MPFSPAFRNHFLCICTRKRDVIRALCSMNVADLVPVLSRNLRGLEVLRELDAYVMRLESGRAYYNKAFVGLGYAVEHLALFLRLGQPDHR